MKYRYLSIFLILLILSIGAVCAQEDIASDDSIDIAQDDVLSSEEYIIDDSNYNDYFNNETGAILENSNISDGDIIKLGNINNKDFFIDKNLTFTSASSSDILTNVSFCFVEGSDDSIIENLNFSNGDAQTTTISIFSASNISITENIINVSGAENSEDLYVIYADLADNLSVKANVVSFVAKTNGTNQNKIIYAKYSDYLFISGNDITASLPSRSIDWSTGAVYSEGVFLDDCDNAVLDSNSIIVKSNDKISDYDTIYAVHIIGENATIMDGEIDVNEAPYGYAIVVSGENFNITGNNIVAIENESYACGIDVESNSNGVISDNVIVVKGVSAYGIYTANWAGDVKANILGNMISADGNSVFGMSLSGSEITAENNDISASGNFTTGIAAAVDMVFINNNSITASGSNEGTPLGYDTMGIETIGVHIVSGDALVKYNNITSNSRYAVEIAETGAVTDNYLVAEVLTGDFAVDYVQDDDVLVANNTPEMELDYKLTNDTFYIYFDDEGILREQITGDNLTFIGEFSNLVEAIIIDKPIALLSDNATLNNIAIFIQSDDVSVDGFNLIGDLAGINISEADNVEIMNNNFIITCEGDFNNLAIGIYDSDNVLLENNTIVLGVETNGTYINRAIHAQDSENLTLLGNTIVASLPARSINWTSGTVYSEGVILDGCDNAYLFNNTVAVKSNDQISTYDTIYAVDIKGDNASLIGNRIGVLEAPYGYGVVISGENFEIAENEIYIGQNGTYACAIEVDGPSNGMIDTNLIYAIANESAYGIYTANWAGNVIVDIIDNFVYANSNSPFAMSLSGSETTVENNTVLAKGNFTTGIAAAVDMIFITGNNISANGSNEGTPLGYDMMGIETIGIHIVSGDALVKYNNITSNSRYAVEIAETGAVTDNYLVAEVLTGDFAVDYVQDDDVLVANNTPEMELDYKLTNDTFYIYFDDEGILREQITCDNLTFIGEFSNLVENVTIDKPIALLSDNAILNNMAIDICSENVTVDGFNFIGEYSGISIYNSDNVQVMNSNFNIDGFNEGTNVAIEILDSDNVLIDNNTIIFNVETNETYENVAIYAEESDNLLISNNNITASLPARSIDWSAGTVYSEGICLNDCDNAILYSNDISISSNDKISEYDTIYAVMIAGENALVSENQISVSDAPYGYALVVSGENFNITENVIFAGHDESYACGIDVESNSKGAINENMIVVAGDSAYGIYTANWAGDVQANITDNKIFAEGNSVFGMSLSGSQAMVENNEVSLNGNFTTGIASAVDMIFITNNTILANGSNEGTPLGYDTMGIETIGVHSVSGDALVKYNNITSTGDYTVELDGTGAVTDNELVADVLTGDASVDYVLGDAIVVNNTPAMQKAFISAEDVVMYYKNGTRYVIRLTDGEGKPLANKTVTLTINLASYNRTTDENGTASLAINLNSGIYNASALYIGENGFANATVENSIEILTTVLGEDVVKVFRNGTQYYATFLDGQGNPLANGTEVTFNINGVMYKRYVNGSEGKAKLNINLPQGEYIITAINPVNGEMHANNITVLSTIANNTDIQLYYKNGTKYEVTIIGADGKRVGAGENVTFNINGVFYTRQTDENGVARLSINLQPANYTVTAEYNGCKVSNTVEVLPILFANDLVKKYGTSDQFRALLLDGHGKPYPGQNITFNINGRIYQRTTDNDGYAALNIKLGASVNTYIITSSYNGTNIANKIIIEP